MLKYLFQMSDGRTLTVQAKKETLFQDVLWKNFPSISKQMQILSYTKEQL